MTAITSAGVGSGLNVASIVSQLVSSERAPADNRLNSAQAKTQAQISALGTFKAALSGLQTQLDSLTSASGSGSSFKLVSSLPEVFTASASSGIQAGSYAIEVRQLAQAHKLASSAYTSSSAVVGNGTVTLSRNGESFTVTLADGENTLADLRDKINAASDNSGIQASLINESAGTRLLLSGADTGATQGITVSSASAPLLPILPPGPAFVSFTTVQAAQDAELKIDGYTVTSASNQVTTAIDGLTLNLLDSRPGTTGRLTVSTDAEKSAANLAGFVRAYNTFLAATATLTHYDSSSKQAGALLGDSGVRMAQQQVRNVVGGSMSGAGSFAMLADIGISTKKDGTLVIDSTKLNTALTRDSASVGKLFSGNDGIATRLDAMFDSYIGSDGRIGNSTTSLQSRLKDIDRQRSALNLRMTGVEARYRAQFTKLDSLMSQLSGTSSYLSRQLDKL